MESRSTLVRLFFVTGIILFLVVSAQIGPSAATVQWSDDFADGNYDGWNVVSAEWSAADNLLEVVDGTPVGCDLCVIPGIIYHESTVTSGTWSFDIEYDLNSTEEAAVPKFFFMSSDPENWNGYCVEIQPVVSGESTLAAFRLLRGTTTPGVVGTDYTILGSFDVDEGDTGNKHIDVTRAASGQITVYIDGVQAIQATDTVIDAESCEFFVVFSNNEWTIDNVVVDDAITVGQIPLELIAVGGGAAAIIIVVGVVLKIKRG
ncbi:MAG: hypothetical protein ACFFC0_03365 [Promethearchaeota archaeon]